MFVQLDVTSNVASKRSLAVSVNFLVYWTPSISIIKLYVAPVTVIKPRKASPPPRYVYQSSFNIVSKSG